MYAAARFLFLLLALAATGPSLAIAASADDQFAVAAGHYSAGRWDLAADEFRVFVRENPDHAKRGKAMFFFGEALVQRAKYAEAYPLYVELLADEPTGPYAKQALFRAGEAAFMSGQLDEAKVRLMQFQSKHGRDNLNCFVLAYLADMSLRAKDLPTAERLYRECLDRFADQPTADECRLGLAHALEEQQQTEAAEKLLREVAGRESSPWTEMALLTLGAKASAAGNHAAALAHYEDLTKRFPRGEFLPQAQLGRGRALVQLGNHGEAKAILTPLADDKKLGSDAAYWLGLALKAEREYQQAAEVLARAAAEKEAAEQAAAKAATAIAAERERAASEKVAQAKVVEQAPATSTATIRATKSQDASTNYDNGEQKAESANAAMQVTAVDATKKRQAALVRYQAAEAMVRAGDYGRAIGTLQSADLTGPDPQLLASRYLLAVALQGEKRHAEALKHLTELESELTAQSAQSTAAENKTLTALYHNTLVAKATSLVAQEQFDEAIVPLRTFLATEPTDLAGERSRSALAVCLARTGKCEEASRMVEELKTRHPRSPLVASTTHHVAEIAYLGGDYAIAAPLFESLLADGMPTETQAKGLAGLGWSRLKEGNFAAADRAFEKFLQRFPTDLRAPDAAIARGQALEQLGRDDAALAVYRQALGRYPQAKQLPAILTAAAKLHDRLEQDEEAVQLYARHVREFPDSADVDAALYGWAWALRDLGRGVEADKIFRQLHAEHPHSRFHADAAFRLAERAANRGDRQTARQLLKPLLTGDCPEGVLEHALYLQAQLAVQEEKWLEAEPPLRRLIDTFAESELRLPAEFWFAEVAYRRGDYPAAEARFDALSKTIDGNRDRWLGIVPLRRAQVLAHHKQWPEARALAETIATDYPDFDQLYEAEYLIGRCLAAEAKFAEAREAYLRVIRSTTGGKTETAAMAQWMIGESYFHQENYSQALKEYLRVEILYPYTRWQAASLLQAGKCHEQLGQHQEARELYSHVVQKHGQTEFVAEAGQRLEELRKR